DAWRQGRKASGRGQHGSHASLPVEAREVRKRPFTHEAIEKREVQAIDTEDDHLAPPLRAATEKGRRGERDGEGERSYAAPHAGPELTTIASYMSNGDAVQSPWDDRTRSPRRRIRAGAAPRR